MAKRIAPKGGYDFPEKNLYRRQVWNGFVRNCPVDLGKAHCMIMPSLEGIEIDLAIAKGFRQENIHIVDMNPAIVATLKRKYPNVHTYGVTIGEAFKRMQKNGVTIHVANFDFTSNISPSLFKELRSVEISQVLSRRACISLTLLRGREGKKVLRWEELSVKCNAIIQLSTDFLNRVCLSSIKPTGRDATRIVHCMSYIARMALFNPTRLGIYKSGMQTMMWMSCTLYHMSDVVGDLERIRNMQVCLGKIPQQYDNKLNEIRYLTDLSCCLNPILSSRMDKFRDAALV